MRNLPLGPARPARAGHRPLALLRPLYPLGPSVEVEAPMNGGALFRRVVRPANRWTFEIPEVREIVDRFLLAPPHVGPWVDPFAGRSVLGVHDFTNDLDPDSPAAYHLEAEQFVREIVPAGVVGVLWDPPYSYRQISDCYHALGRKATTNDTNSSFYSRVRKPLVEKLAPSATVVYCGWDTIPFAPGFEIVEGLIVCHGGGHRHDTLVTVQRRPA